MTTPQLDFIRNAVLARMDAQERAMKFAILGAAVAEALLLSYAVWLIDWSDRTQVVVFVLSILSYLIIALGMIALGAHVSRSASRVVAAIEGTRDA